MKRSHMFGSHGFARMRAGWFLLVPAAVAVLGAFHRPIRSAELAAPSPILQELRSFRVYATVLHVGAHPDDENTQLIAYLSRGRAYRAAYLSVTRGDGGQNLLGPQLGEKLGVARTQELLAARRIDGGQQFFTRALDYGFSKDVNEALTTWDHQQVLSDVVRVIRTFRPDVIITRFSTEPGGTHGHHTASAVLALEAFKLAGDPKAFPEQLKDLTPWQPKRIFVNAGQNGARGGTPANAVRMDIGGDDAVSGESFASIASRSRRMHKTQGFDQGGGGGGRGGGGGGPAPQSFVLLDGAPATNDIMDGIDTTWNRVSGGADIAQRANDVMTKFDAANPSASVPALLEIRGLAAKVPTDPVVADKRRLLDHIIVECLGLTAETTLPQPEVVPGESVRLHHVVTEHASIPVRWVAVRYPSLKTEMRGPGALAPDQQKGLDAPQTIPASMPLTQPYWLIKPGTVGMFRVDDATLIGRPESPPAVPVEFVFDVGGQTLVVPDEPVQAAADPRGPEMRRKLAVVSPVPLHFTSNVQLFAPASDHSVSVELVASRPGLSGSVQLDAPANWKVAPATQTFRLAAVGDSAKITFTVTAPAQAQGATIGAHATIGGARYSTGRVEIKYDHIPFQLLQPTAQLIVTGINLAIRGKNVGYVPGAGDDIPQAMTQMGYTVTTINGVDDATPAKLHGLDAIVVGIRAFNVRTDLDSLMPRLFAYIEQGGTVIEQYNQNGQLKSTKFAPYPLQVQSAANRITEETSPVTFLLPDHPSLNVPNKITSADFDGWVQERGTYFPSQWDSHFAEVLSMKDSSDPKPLTTSLLVAKYGKGYFVYTGIVFFRELPAGVPGAYRLFANLLALGQSGIVP